MDVHVETHAQLLCRSQQGQKGIPCLGTPGDVLRARGRSRTELLLGQRTERQLTTSPILPVKSPPPQRSLIEGFTEIKEQQND